jgi:hypothetical protein
MKTEMSHDQKIMKISANALLSACSNIETARKRMEHLLEHSNMQDEMRDLMDSAGILLGEMRKYLNNEN